MNQRKNIPSQMAIQEFVYYTNFSVVLCCSVLYMRPILNSYIWRMTRALKSLHEMQQTTSMRFTIIPHDITVIYVTYFQMYYYLMQ